MELYAKQARNFEAEKRAASIRIYAELQTGKMLREAQKAKGGDTRKPKEQRLQRESGARTLKQLGISETQSSRWQGLAENPNAVEKYLRDEPSGVRFTGVSGSRCTASSSRCHAAEHAGIWVGVLKQIEA